MRIILEVIAVTVEDALAAERGGADRLELIANFLEGGTTPSPGVIRSVKRAVSIPVNVMLRPHGGGFVYSPLEVDAMIYDAALVRRAGADGIVVGALCSDGTIDTETITRIVDAARLPATFHRAFDMLPEATMPGAVRTLAELPWIERVLTSGGRESAYEGRKKIAELVRQQTLSIMPGKGVGHKNIKDLVLETGVREVHVGTAVRHFNKPTSPVCEEKVRRLKEILAVHLH
ncbi:MAG: copper homeostasis protein CutC [Limnochordia bacterium]